MIIMGHIFKASPKNKNFHAPVCIKTGHIDLTTEHLNAGTCFICASFVSNIYIRGIVLEISPKKENTKYLMDLVSSSVPESLITNKYRWLFCAL